MKRNDPINEKKAHNWARRFLLKKLKIRPSRSKNKEVRSETDWQNIICRLVNIIERPVIEY